MGQQHNALSRYGADVSPETWKSVMCAHSPEAPAAVVIVYSSSTIAAAATPSPCPVKPIPSVVVALTLTSVMSI